MPHFTTTRARHALPVQLSQEQTVPLIQPSPTQRVSPVQLSQTQRVPPVQLSPTQRAAPIQPHTYQEDVAKIDEEKRLMKSLKEHFDKLAGNPGSYDKELRQFEIRALAQEESAIRIGESILISRNQDALVKEQKQEMGLWWEAIEDWRKWIDRGKRMIRIVRAIVLCNNRANEFWVGLPTEVREGKIEVMIEHQRRTVIEPEIVQMEEDRKILSSERKLINCEENFGRWDKKLLGWEEELIKRQFWEEQEDERKMIQIEKDAIEGERKAMEQARRAMAREKMAIEQERMRLTKNCGKSQLEQPPKKKSTWQRLVRRRGEENSG
jgi:hypothetical protein